MGTALHIGPRSCYIAIQFLAADVAGYSRLMAADEVGTLTALKAHRREVVDPAIGAHHGQIVKTTGDAACWSSLQAPLMR